VLVIVAVPLVVVRIGVQSLNVNDRLLINDCVYSVLLRVTVVSRMTQVMHQVKEGRVTITPR
jgi:hypothetical protein